jgi:glycosyltransferase involved in cell wall biosynthesis
MRIGIDFTAAARQGAGIGRFTRGLVRALLSLHPEHEFRLMVAGRGPSPFLQESLPDGTQAHYLPLSERTLSRMWHRLRVPLPVETFIGKVDLFHSPDFVLPPTLTRRTVLTVHDLSFLRVPECAQPSLEWYLRGAVPRSVRHAALLTADSESTRRDLNELLGVPLDRVVVVPGGVDGRFQRVTDADALRDVRRRYGLDRPCILYVGTIEPRKNLSRLIKAFALARTHGLDDHVLALCGKVGWLTEDIFQAAAESGLGDRVRFPGYVRDEDLPALYSAADVFAFPSLYEGFGLGPLEAMACGAPTLVSNVSSLPEVVADAAAQVDPTNVEAMAAALAALVTDSGLRARLAAAGPARAAQFTWEDAARGLLDAYESLA